MNRSEQNERRRVISFLASMPAAHSTVTKEDAKEIMLDTGGTLFCNGLLRNIVIKSIGAGVYKIWTEAC
jgi:hypothetical protein